MIHLDCSRVGTAPHGAEKRARADARAGATARCEDQCIEMPTSEDETVARLLSLDIAHHLPSWSNGPNGLRHPR
jgi:hypothetical protein